MAKKSEKDTQTAGENVYQYLRSGILNLQVKPGQTININELSEYLKVSRSPIRDALIQLARDDLVTMTPQKGTIVSKIDITRAKDERFMRTCVEERVLEEFVEKCSKKDMAALEESGRKQQELVQKKDLRGYMQADDEFHSVFYLATNHASSLRNILNMSSHYYRMRLLSLTMQGVSERSLQQHQEIMRLIREKNNEELRQLIRIHVVEKSDEEGFLAHRYPELFTGIPEDEEPKCRIWEEDFLLTF